MSSNELVLRRNFAILAVIACAGAASSIASAASLTTLASFNNSNGSQPQAGLIADAAGNLYGTAEFGGVSNKGTVFELAAGSSTIIPLASFTGSNGENPMSSLIADASGNLYGTTEIGGANNDGTVFKLAAGTNTISTLVSFNRSNGADPQAGLIADATGNLYGTTSSDGPSRFGTVFELDPTGPNLTTLASFSIFDGEPVAGLVAGADGNLYGTTRGILAGGKVFKVDPTTGDVTTLISFSGSSGNSSIGNLIFDAAGNLYGTTVGGGLNGDGSVFKLDPNTTTLTTLYSFDGSDGSAPHAGLIMDAAGNLYGTTTTGGANGDGTVFKLDPAGNLTTLATFDGPNGANPYGDLIADATGNLYGTTAQGGAVGTFGAGTIFELTNTGFVLSATTVPLPAAVYGGSFLLLPIALRRRCRHRRVV